ncbi:MAG TPA: PaaI family thioesterase [Gammaproteobacteria bacterium]|nr:PaaI family thioesterase [Gammaproteobacteria bacterium]
MSLYEVVTRARETGDYGELMSAVPYAALLGMRMRREDGRLLFHLPFNDRNIGNVMLPALHGGVIGGFMEHAAICQLIAERESVQMPKTIDFSIDYLRSGRAADTHAVCRVTKQGKRVAHVGVDAWQASPDKPIAVARAHFLLT